jgi:hypothetical protein
VTMTMVKTWGLTVLVMAVAFTIFFSLIVGKRGWDLAIFVVVLSLFLSTVTTWARTRSQRK